MRPSRVSLIVAGLWLALGIVTAFIPSVLQVWQVFGVFFAAVAVIDCFYVFKRPKLRIKRLINQNLPVSTYSKVTISIKNQDRHAFKFVIYDHHPEHFLVQDLPQQTLLLPKKKAVFNYSVKPRHRGPALFKKVELLIFSPFRLWKRRYYFNIENHVKVFPDFARISHYVLLATDNRLSQIGVRRRQRRGEGNDFHQLREYRIGDSMKQIDWKATSRYRKLISKEYQDERNQQVIFLIDCGRRMRHMEHSQVHLDQTLNAMMLVAYVAIAQGDAVGFLSFAGTHRWCPPQKGKHTVNALLNKIYDLRSSTQAADYMMAARQLMPLQRKRSLVVILTNTRDEDHHDLQAAIKLLQSRHLVLLADLREEIIDRTLQQNVHDMDQALQFHTVSDYLNSRRNNHESLQHYGAITLDTTAEQLPVLMVNRYLDIKSSGRL